MKEVTTWQDVLDYLKTLSADQLKQTVQVAPHYFDESEPLPLHPGIGIGTCGELELDQALNADDHKRHDEHIVLLTDTHPFGDEGEMATDMLTGEKWVPKNLSWSGAK